MAAVARSHGIEVEIGSFEQWDDAGRRFDLIISAQAWHWVDPQIGAPKAARLLTDGATVALFWNFDDLDDASQAVVDAVYARVAPEVASTAAHGASRRDDRPYVADLVASGAFRSITTHNYAWQRTMPIDAWVGMVGTHSDHVLLGPARLAELQDALRSAVTDAGDEVRLTRGTYLIWARR